MNKLKKFITVLSFTGLLSMSFPFGNGYAEDNTPEINSIDLSLLNSLEEHPEEVDLEDMLPKNFLYFMKEALETLQLKLAVSDHGKALLITEFANNRLDLATELMESGNYDQAVAFIDEAIKHHLLAREYDKENNNLEEVIEEDEAEDVIGDSETVVEDPIVIDESEDSDETDNTQEEFHQSIISLLKNIEKIENSNAKAALTRNVERKIEKLGLDRSLVFGEPSVDVESKDSNNVTINVAEEEVTDSSAVVLEVEGNDNPEVGIKSTMKDNKKVDKKEKNKVKEKNNKDNKNNKNNKNNTSPNNESSKGKGNNSSRANNR